VADDAAELEDREVGGPAAEGVVEGIVDVAVDEVPPEHATRAVAEVLARKRRREICAGVDIAPLLPPNGPSCHTREGSGTSRAP
jgi:hypothetical protein